MRKNDIHIPERKPAPRPNPDIIDRGPSDDTLLEVAPVSLRLPSVALPSFEPAVREPGPGLVDRIPEPRMCDATVGQAHKWLWERLNDGQTPRCPCCDQRAAIRGQRFSESMAVFLCRLVRLQLTEPPGPYSTDHVLPGRKQSRASKRSTDASYLKHFGLLVQPKSGWYLALPAGMDYVLGGARLHAPKIDVRVMLYDARRTRGWSYERVTIWDALGSRKSVLRDLLRELNIG